MAALHHKQNMKAEQIVQAKNIFAVRASVLKYELTGAWYRSSRQLMKGVLALKFNQCEEFRNELQNTNCKEYFVLGTDFYWMCGLLKRYAFWSEPNEFPGSNVLGEILMTDIRQMLAPV